MFKKKIGFLKAHKDAVIPQFAHKEDAGMDICSIEECVLKAGDFRVVKTGLKADIPKGYEIQIRGRSGMAAKYGIGPVNGIGTIDCGYKGEMGVILANHSKKDFKIEKGMRIAQLVVAKLAKVKPIEIKSLDHVKSERGEGGFGSSGTGALKK